MEIKLPSEKLARAIRSVSYAVKKNEAVPILDNVAFQCMNGRLYVKATDQLLTIIVNMPHDGATVDTGAFLLPHEQLSSLLGTMATKETVEALTIKIGGDYAHVIEWATGSQEMNGEDPLLFPKREKVEGQLFTIPGAEALDFAIALGSVAFACANDDLSLSLMGVNVSLANGMFKAVGSNRLVFAVAELKTKLPGTFTCTVSKRFANALERIIVDGASGELKLRVSKSAISATIGANTIECRLIDEPYPDITKLLSYSSPSNLLVNKKGLALAISRAITTAPKETNAIYLKPIGKLLHVESFDIGRKVDTREEVVIDWSNQDKPVTIFVAGKTLQNVLNTFEDTTVRISWTNDRLPLRISRMSEEVNYYVIVSLLAPDELKEKERKNRKDGKEKKETA